MSWQETKRRGSSLQMQITSCFEEPILWFGLLIYERKYLVLSLLPLFLVALRWANCEQPSVLDVQEQNYKIIFFFSAEASRGKKSTFIFQYSHMQLQIFFILRVDT